MLPPDDFVDSSQVTDMVLVEEQEPELGQCWGQEILHRCLISHVTMVKCLCHTTETRSGKATNKPNRDGHMT